MTRERILAEALKLPTRERADVAAELLQSLDEESEQDNDEVERAWGLEIERRARRHLSGESAAIPWEDVKSRIERSFARR